MKLEEIDMSRYKDEQCRICRRNGQKLFLKGERCYSDKCSINRRNYAPGQNGQKRAKLSEYGTQLREKQKAKAYYGVGEKQFRKYFEMAANSKEKTGDKLLILLESRLDNVVYRLGFASSRAQARMLVTHATFDVNGKKVNIPSFLVKPGDVISVREIEKENGAVKTAVEENEARPVPTWLEKEEGKLSGKVIKLASREDIDLPIEEHLIVEYYSK
jgi:small subunit ribosomal protein S4